MRAELVIVLLSMKPPREVLRVLIVLALQPLAFAQPAGTILWNFDSGERALRILLPAVDDDGTIYAASQNRPVDGVGKVFALQPDGRKKWEHTPSRAITSPVVVGEQGALYVATEGGLLALGLDGQFKWLWPASSGEVLLQPAIATDGTIYFGLRSLDPRGSALIAINPDGTTRWKFKVNSLSESIPSIGPDGMVYFGDADRLHAIYPDGSEYWSIPMGRAYVLPRSPSSLLVNGSLGFYEMNPDGVANTLGGGGGPPYSIFIGPDGLIGNSSMVMRSDLSLTGSGLPMGIAFGADYVVYSMASGGVLTASLFQGGVQWQRTFEVIFENQGAVMGPDGVLYVGDVAGQLYAVKASCGPANSVWPQRFGNARHNGRAAATGKDCPCLTPLRLAHGRGSAHALEHRAKKQPPVFGKSDAIMNS